MSGPLGVVGIWELKLHLNYGVSLYRPEPRTAFHPLVLFRQQ